MINANIVSMELVVIILHNMKNVAQNYILLDLSQKKAVLRNESFLSDRRRNLNDIKQHCKKEQILRR